MSDLSGRQIEHYQIIERLGMGGMAVVYKAYDVRLERYVAIKLIRTREIPESQHERLFKRFDREAKALAQFSHRNIIPVYDFGDVNGSPYLVMALVPGGTLKDRINGPVNWQQAVSWVIPISEALSYAHRRGIVHRDVKPANILFDTEDQPILTDFGIAKILETEEVNLTGTGLGVGTPEYMAPEQWQGKISPATDQYALGVVLYELITGRKPYSADTPAAVAIIQATEPLPSPSGFVKDLPTSLEKILYKALARVPQDRFESMEAFSKALNSLLVEKETSQTIPNSARIRPTKSSTQATRVKTIEDLTRDIFDSSPSNVHPRNNKVRERLNRRFPKWVVWAGGGIIGMTIIGFALGLGGKIFSQSVDGQTTQALQPTQTETLITATGTTKPTITETPLPIKTATVTLTLGPTLGIGSILTNEIDGAEMVYITAGEFLMGSNDGETNESPEHIVYLSDYWIYKNEVTNRQYRQCIEAGSCSGSLTDFNDDNYPAAEVNWGEAAAYCEWAGGDLPTEAQWEKAARGTDGQTFPWGENYPSCYVTNFAGCEDGTKPVGSYPIGASPYGIFDMAGNVWEWVADWYDESYYTSSPNEDPTGPSTGTTKIIRGGSIVYYWGALRSSVRVGIPPETTEFNIGFRCSQLIMP